MDYVLFDLPTMTKAERHASGQFRKFLLDQGFEMAQLSVYLRHTNGKEAVNAIIRKIEGAVPPKVKWISYNLPINNTKIS